jgi:hypothetical protein
MLKKHLHAALYTFNFTTSSDCTNGPKNIFFKYLNYA